MFVSIETSAHDGAVLKAHGSSIYPEVERILSSFAPKLRLEALTDLQRLGWNLVTTVSFQTDEGVVILDTLSMDETVFEPDDDLVSLRRISTDVPSFQID